MHSDQHAPRTIPDSTSTDSTGGLVAASTNGDLPLFHPQRRDTPSTRSKSPRRGMRRHLLGWKLLVLGSWLNVLLLFLPVAWVIGWAVPEWASVVFACCILGLIPLVKLHELTTMELSLRLGSSRTGLINATMGNLVEIVVAFSALRRCELKVVQSALLGSMLSKMLLVLGMCFFAGGLRFSEQDFDSTATGINSSLLSISVGAVILPTAYHFSLHAGSEASPDERRGILKMSHGVSIILLFIYLSYLLFQLWSHTHLYNNGTLSNTQRSPRMPNGPAMVLKQRSPGGTWRRRFSSDMDSVRAFEKLKSSEDVTTATLSLKIRQREDTLVEKPSKMYSAPMMSRSETTLAGSSTLDLNEKVCSSEGVGKPTVRLVNENGSVKDARRVGSLDSIDSSVSEEAEWRPRILSPVAEVTSREERSQATQEDEQREKEGEVPRLSVFLTIVTLVVVTILVVVTADSLVETLDEISKSVSKQWIGLILLPAVTSVAEMVTAVNVSVKDQLAFSINLAVGSTIQTALFVIPLMVCVGWAMEKPMSLLFDPFESVVLYIAVQTMSYVVADGKSNWLEGMILICLYMTIGVAFWYYPGANLPISLTTC
ncbi:Ca(2+):cation antiporter (CaCA) family protein [Pleurotus pulmonarius]